MSTDSPHLNQPQLPLPPRQRLQLRETIVPLLLIIVGTALIPVGPQLFWVVSPFLQHLPLPTFVWRFALLFAHPAALLIAAALVWALRPQQRSLIIYIFLAALLATLCTSTIKELTGRRRPEWSIAMDKEREKSLQELAAKHPDKYIPIERRDIWAGPRRDRLWFSVKDASFPSGHTTAAFSLAAALALFFPRGRWLWLLCASLSAAARVKSQHHYVEDVLVAAGLTWLICQWVYSWRWPVRLTSHLKRCFFPRNQTTPKSLQASSEHRDASPPCNLAQY
jgi:membrane-associated phospholipid phosphatase